MTAAEKRRYVVGQVVAHLRGGTWFGYAPLAGDGAAIHAVPGPRFATRLRQTAGVVRAARRATKDA